MIRDALLWIAACLRVGGLLLLAFAGWAGFVRALTVLEDWGWRRRHRGAP